jgi:hypothetical protein
MTQAELLRYLVDVLETLGAEYMIGGSQASIYYGEPRLTRDVDVIVALSDDHAHTFATPWGSCESQDPSWMSATSRNGPSASV